ncbi:chloride channel protein [Bordetella genomosp. 9]|uniref:chloride channel protein n=1 Tax=Bordetella genomosp. 9 TaxID=1416803 RepID=UPI000A294444|nr:chloride channel protein [Bordetella genomosp. 9]ARP90577.1 chloride channel protein [Bordetella genomosp. 9]
MSASPSHPSSHSAPPRLGDFTTDKRVLAMMLMAAVAGGMGVAAAWVLLRLITLCTNLAYYGRFTLEPLPIAGTPYGAWSVLVPVAGCIVIGLMARYGSEKIRGHGIPEAMEAILIGKSRIQPKVALLKPLSSAVSIGTGGPFGAEGPIIMTGGALGSLLAQAFHVTAAERKTLLVAGAAAGMTAVFGTPIAAVLLAVELLLFEWKPRSFLPVATAAAVAGASRTLLLDAGPLFPYAGHAVLTAPHFLSWACIGLMAGIGSGVLTAMVYGAEDAFQKLPLHWMWWPAIGGLAIGIGGLIEPAALGVGYDNIRHLLDGTLTSHAVLLLLAVKAVIWAIALGSGTSGGVLAPLLIFGGALGALATGFMPHAETGLWAALGMAAMMGGTMRAPLTATLFCVELTGNSSLLLPVLTASTVAYGVTVLLLKRSILTEKIARRGHHVVREYHVDPLELVRVQAIMRQDVMTLPGDMTMGQALAFFESDAHRHTAYPVVDPAGRVRSVVTQADILAWTSDTAPVEQPLGEVLADRAPMLGYPDETAGALADRMAATGVGRVPIVDRRDGRLVGIVSRADLMQVRARRREEESVRERYLLRARPAAQADAASLAPSKAASAFRD